MNDDILKKLGEMQKADLHDPAWLQRQEGKLREHMRMSPRPPVSSHSTLLIGIVAIIAVVLIVFLGNERAPQNIPTSTPTPLPSASSTPSPSITPPATPSPTVTITPTPTPTRIPTVSPAPTIAPTL